MSTTLITCKELALAYETGIVVSGVSFTLEEGQYLCIVGENGSGKSTLLKALIGLHPVEQGSLTLHPDLRRGGIGYLPQHTPVQRDFPASVREIVRSGCLRRRGFSPFWHAEDKWLAEEAMERMGIRHLASRCYRELSGGQQQRVLLARAYCATGRLMLLDEPIAGLDPMAMMEMYSMIAKLHKEGVAIIMVSHDVTAALQYATHILHLGKTTCFFGRTEEYLASPMGQQFTRREGGGYQAWSPKTLWDAPNMEEVLGVRVIPDARSVLGKRGVSRDEGLVASRRRTSSEKPREDAP